MRHDKIKMRLLGVAVLLLAVAVILLVYFFGVSPKDNGQSDKGLGKKETIHLWYTDDALTDYLANKALEFYDRTDIRVEVKLVSGLEYLEAINKASIDRDGDAPDLYILSNDSLEKAYLAGLAVGYWKSTEEVLQNQQIDRIFTPDMDAKERNVKRKGWNKAVKYAYGWAKNELEQEDD